MSLHPLTFGEFLEEKFIDDEPMILDDDLPDATDAWIENLDVSDVIKYANEYAELSKMHSYEKGLKDGANPLLNK